MGKKLPATCCYQQWDRVLKTLRPCGAPAARRLGAGDTGGFLCQEHAEVAGPWRRKRVLTPEEEARGSSVQSGG